MKSGVMISIDPKSCELIASGEKTIEVRKTKPSLETPFKCYIYCTKPKNILRYVWGNEDYAGYGETQMRDKKTFCKIPDGSSPFCSPPYSGMVIGEFVCDRIYELAPINHAPDDVEKQACLTREEIVNYIRGCGYGWHINDLKIYDIPKELSEFYAEDKIAIKQCKHRFRYGQPETVTQHGGWIKGGFGCMKNGEPEWCENCLKKPLTRPPQSWCYVEELK